MIKVAPLRYDVIFKKVFSKPHIFTAFVKDIAGIDIEIDKVETEKSFAKNIGKIGSRFDLFAEDKKNRIIVDIQHKRHSDHYDRFLYYHCAAILQQATNSKNYGAPMRVYTIVILTSGDKYKTPVSTTDFAPKTIEGESLEETQHKIIYICPKYLNEKTPETYQEWLKAIDDSLDGEVEESKYHNPIIHEIFATIEEEQITPQEYARMKDEYSNEEYLLKKTQQAKQEGRQEAVEDNAKKMLEKGLDFALISEITGLSLDSLKKILRK